MSQTVAYIRVSTDEQDTRNQKFEILNYCDHQKWQVDTWMELEVSTRQSTKDRQLDKLLSVLNAGDRLIVAELSRIGRSTAEVIQFVNEIATNHDLTLADVYAALAYYYDHREELDAQIKESNAFVESFRQQISSKIPEKLHAQNPTVLYG